MRTRNVHDIETASILAFFFLSKQNEPAYSEILKDRSEANSAYYNTLKDRSETMSA